ncbi:DUF928 domain-containing protein [Tychonema sp. LEGE 07203]|uniref:DUF928 domain-containing protein n=1 Tax=Tychonema sp. LEGE 07203 TaxID=1828671 RepID=UPI00187E4F01|nr:DUF928 domain-containing protein [Tychonema sp. LEGE 07203]MBE9096498.1 DUF928 domain-containing protein [Tychonema sp. LEGE 07203]
MYQVRWYLLCVLIWAIGSASAIANSPIKVSTTTKTNPPSNTKPGGGLDPTNLSCKKTDRPLTALSPRNNFRSTTSEHPTFWFYIPYSPEDIKKGEFVLLTFDEKTLIYETAFEPPKTPGIVSISLPPSPEYALEEGKSYRWYLRLYCKNSRRSGSDLAVDGWLNRVAATAETERSIDAGAPDIWYDSLTRLGNLLLVSPDEKSRNDWNKLLESIGEKELAKEQLVGPVVLVKE